jgi:hypothetical protein
MVLCLRLFVHARTVIVTTVTNGWSPLQPTAQHSTHLVIVIRLLHSSCVVPAVAGTCGYCLVAPDCAFGVQGS